MAGWGTGQGDKGGKAPAPPNWHSVDGAPFADYYSNKGSKGDSKGSKGDGKGSAKGGDAYKGVSKGSYKGESKGDKGKGYYSYAASDAGDGAASVAPSATPSTAAVAPGVNPAFEAWLERNRPDLAMRGGVQGGVSKGGAQGGVSSDIANLADLDGMSVASEAPASGLKGNKGGGKKGSKGTAFDEPPQAQAQTQAKGANDSSKGDKGGAKGDKGGVKGDKGDKGGAKGDKGYKGKYKGGQEAAAPPVVDPERDDEPREGVVLEPRRYRNKKRGYNTDSSGEISRGAAVWVIGPLIELIKANEVTFAVLDDNDAFVRCLAKQQRSTYVVLDTLFNGLEQAMHHRAQDPRNTPERLVSRVLLCLSYKTFLYHVEAIAGGSLEDMRQQQDGSKVDGFGRSLTAFLLLIHVYVLWAGMPKHRRRHDDDIVTLERLRKHEGRYAAEVKVLAEKARANEKAREREEVSDGVWESTDVDPLPAIGLEVQTLLREIEEQQDDRAALDPDAEVTYHDYEYDLFGEVFRVREDIPNVVVNTEVPSLEWHFDTQFHLLREDFLMGLREALTNMGHRPTNKVWFNKNVCVQGIGTHGESIVHQVRLPLTGKKRFPRDRLMNGSLLCFSDNRFEKDSLLFGVVAGGRTDETPTYIDFTVRFQGLGDVVADEAPKYDSLSGIVGDSFDMIETRVYYEAYSHIIRCLHTKDVANLPFTGILTANPDALANIQPPKNLATRDLVINALLVDDTSKYPAKQPFWWRYDKERGARTPFPDVEVMLDPSQLECVQNALTHEVCVIQGPPGTGKSFVGSRVARVILDTLWGFNRDKTFVVDTNNGVQWSAWGRDFVNEEHYAYHWDNEPDDDDIDGWEYPVHNPPAAPAAIGPALPKPKPILILCHTNHALDSVLTDLLGFDNEEEADASSGNRPGPRGKHERQPQMHRDDVKEVERTKPCHEDRVLRIGGSSKVQAIKGRAITQVLRKVHCGPLMKSLSSARWRLRQRVEVTTTSLEPHRLAADARSIFPANFHAFLQRLRDMWDRRIEKLKGQVKVLLQESRSYKPDTRELWEVQQKIALRQEQTTCARRFHDDPLGSWLRGDVLRHMQDEDEAVPEDWDAPEVLPDHEDEHEERFVARVAGGNAAGDDNDDDGDANLLNKNLSMDDYRRMHTDECWRYFDHWTRAAREAAKQNLYDVCEEYDEHCKRLAKERDRQMVKLMGTARVVGATTTGCAKLSHVMEKLKPEVIIVEEAAEVLESHILSVLTPHTKHLILIGDHKQLQPKVNEMFVERKGLSISMMERLVCSGLTPSILLTQRRMVDPICRLTAPFYEPQMIETHPSTAQHPQKVKGLVAPLWFVSHSEPESNPDGASPHNTYEGKYSIAIAGHLVRQGYKPSQITMLVAYKGQQHWIKDYLRTTKDVWNDRKTLPKLKEIRVVCVDAYQGEENDIVILSLVRSNAGRAYGFLKKENRLIVALSRARWAMYVLANMEFLQTASPEWKALYYRAHQQNVVGDALEIECQRHKVHAKMKSYDYFTRYSPRGGCNKLCGVRMDCGHACKQLCHADNYDHEIRFCEEKCDKFGADCTPPRTCKHVCEKYCQDECGDCLVMMERVLPCGHRQMAPCFLPIDKISCKTPCIKRLPCGHICPNLCGKECSTACPEKVDKKLPCGHTVRASCHKNVREVQCNAPCDTEMPCGHNCSGKCRTCTKNNITIHACTEKCRRLLACGHVCGSQCSKQCPPCEEDCTLKCAHSTCPKKCGEECPRCRGDCTWKCPHLSCTKQCWEPCNRPQCNEKCPKMLSCGHACRGLCGDPCPKFCEDCNIGLDKYQDLAGVGEEFEAGMTYVELGCGHIFDSESMDSYVRVYAEPDADKKVSWLLCPTCRAPVQPEDTGRYRKEVNQGIVNVNEVRKRVRDQHAIFKKAKEALGERLERFRGDSTGLVWRYLYAQIKAVGYEGLPSLVRQVDFLEWSAPILERSSEYGDYEGELQEMRTAVLTQLVSEAAVTAAVRDVRRLVCLGKLTQQQRLADPANDDCRKEVGDALARLQVARKLEEQDLDEWEAEVVRIEKLVGKSASIALAKMAMTALGMGAGHWFKCPRGHFYVIGDCGGAQATGRCPDCNEQVGGRDYGLASGNAYAGNLLVEGAEPSWNVPGMQHGV